MTKSMHNGITNDTFSRCVVTKLANSPARVNLVFTGGYTPHHVCVPLQENCYRKSACEKESAKEKMRGRKGGREGRGEEREERERGEEERRGTGRNSGTKDLILTKIKKRISVQDRTIGE